jgi:hypothetical protein
MSTSINRVGLVVATLAAILTVGGAFVLDGYLSAQGAAVAALTTPADNSQFPSATGTLPPELVYVRPAPSPKVIHVTRTKPSAAPRVLHLTVPATRTEGGDHEEADDGGD